MDYRNKLKQRLYLAIAYIVIGIAMIAASFLTNSDNTFISSYGFALIVLGIVRIRNYRIITRSDARIKQQEIMEKDERNIMIHQKAQSMAFILYIMLIGCAVIIFALLNMQQFVQPLAASVCLLVIIYWFSYFYIRRKY